MEIIKRVVSILVIGALLFFLVLYMQKSCAMERENANLYKQYQIAKKDIEASHKSYQILRERSATQIKELDTRISLADANIASLSLSLEGKDKKLGELEKGYANLLDKDEKIVNLEGQVTLWKQKFTIAQGIIAQKDKIIFSLTEKYEQQSKLTYECEGLLSKETELRLLAEKRIEVLHKSITASYFTGKVKTVLIGGLICAVVYGVVK